ncbi:hypothetical protein PE36_09031 [Moritella sp. PE36]|nr:hypothetical protein PE36_09031 [Moritella sp. PE36]
MFAMELIMSKYDLDSIFKSIDSFGKKLELLPTKLSDVWSQAVQLGWYPTPYMPGKLSSTSLSSQQTLDSRMLKAFEKRYVEEKQYVLAQAGNREHILSVALQLHEQENYIASIPLLLSQSDGVFENYLGLSAFARREDKLRKIETKLSDVFDSNSIAKAYFGQFSSPSQFSENSNCFEQIDKAKAPNRNGILHGDSKHLDYGSYINSCKSICFLSSVLWLAEQYREKQT